MSPGTVALISVSEGSHSFEQSGNIVRRANIFDGHAQEFAPGIAVLVYCGGVYRKKAQRFPVKHPGRMWIVLEQFAVPLFALPDHLFGPLALAHVRDHAHHPDGLALLVADDLSFRGNPAHSLVRSNDSAFELKATGLKCLLKSLLHKLAVLGKHVVGENRRAPVRKKGFVAKNPVVLE